MGRGEFIEGLTWLLGELNALHPFREGNGRAQRAFCSQLAHHAGHPVRWAGMNFAENVAASRASLRGDNRALRALLERLIDGADPSPSVPQPSTGRGPHMAQ